MTTLDGLLEQIGLGLREARVASKLSIRGFCRNTKQESTNYTNIEMGKRRISLSKLVELAGQHNCDVVITIVNKGEWTHASSK